MSMRFTRAESVLILIGLAVLSVAGSGALLTAQRSSEGSKGGADVSRSDPWQKPVPKAQCGKGDRVATGLQGQTSLAERMSGAMASSFNCNLELVGQYQGEGANYQMAWFDECAYYGTSRRDELRNKGVVV